MENSVDSVDRPLSEEETKTADGGISQLKLVDKVIHVFHESKDSEGDDVFEEALMDANPEDLHAQKHQQRPEAEEAIVNGATNIEKMETFDPLEVNGSLNELREAEKFEEATEIDLLSEDRSYEVEHPIVVEERIETLVAEPADEVRVAEKGVLEQTEATVASDPVNEVKVTDGIVDEDDNGQEVLAKESKALVASAPVDEVKITDAAVDEEDNVLEESNNSVVGNEEGYVKEVSTVVVSGQTEPSSDANQRSYENCDLIVHDKFENEEEPVLHANSLEIGFSQGRDSSEKIQCQEDARQAIKDAAIMDTPQIKSVMDNLGPFTDERKEVLEMQNPPAVEYSDTDTDERVKVDAAELVAKDCQNSQAQQTDKNTEESSDNHVVFNEPEEQEKQDEQEKQGSVSIKDLSNSNSAREAEIQPSVEEQGKQDEQEKQGLVSIKDLGNSNLAREAEIQPSVEEQGKQDEQEKQDLVSIKDLGNSNLAREAEIQPSVEEKDKQDEQEKQGLVSIKDLGNSNSAEIQPSVEEQGKQDEQKKQGSVSIKDLGNSNSAREAEIQPSVEQQEKQDEQEKQGSVSIKDLGNSNSAREAKIQPSVDPVQPVPPPRPAGLGGAAPLLEPAPRVLQQSRVNGSVPQRQAELVEDPTNGDAEENDETREKLQMIRVKFLRLARRLGQTPHNVVVAQVLYRLGLAEQLRGRNTGRIGAFSFDRASAMAEQLEATGQNPLDFSCTIMVLGKTGVGKSATINSIFDEVKFSTDAFQMGTKKVQDVVGTVQGIKLRVIDTPGLLPCWSDQPQNEKILHSVKQFIKKSPPDIVLYLDRLDMQSRDFGDMPLLHTITEIFGPSIWFNAIVVLTHAASAPPDGPNGIASSYEMFVTQRSHVVQQAIRQVAGDMRLMNPVALVENHSACRTNRAGQRVLPNGQVWKPHLLLLSFASKILAEANTLLKLQDNPPGKPFAARPRAPPLPFLLSSLLQSRSQLKLPEEQFGNEDDLDEDLDESSDSDAESDYDELPPFKRLTKGQLEKLSKTQKKAYFDELEYREKLFMKKQLKEERKRRKLLKKMADSSKDLPNDYNEGAEEESSGAASVPVPMPDFALPISFDSDNPTHRYRFLDSGNQWLVRPVLETHGWDHDVGYEGINVERSFVVKDKIPMSFSGQVTKDKKESNLQMELASSIKHGAEKLTSLGFDLQNVGKDMAYTLRGETRFSNFRHNKTAAGLSVTLLGEALTAGVKLEDKLMVGKRFRLVLTGGAMTARGDVAYGGSLEATLRDKDYPLGRTLSTLGLSVMDWHGDLAIGCNVQSQFPVGRTTNMIARANLNNRGSGQVSIRLNSLEQLQIALIGLLPLFRKIHGYYQQMQYRE